LLHRRGERESTDEDFNRKKQKKKSEPLDLIFRVESSWEHYTGYRTSIGDWSDL
jgi:hypothetical protein